MSSPYNETIRFPNEIDRDWPSLADNTTPWVEQRHIVYPQHYNKLVNLVNTVNGMTAGAPTASGDGTLQRISYPSVFTFKIAALMKVAAPDSVDVPGVNNPGNVLPFEIVFTHSADVYSDRAGAAIVRLSLEEFNALIANQSFFSDGPIVACSVVDDPHNTTLHIDTYVVNHYAVTGSDTILVRGAIIDLGITDPPASSDPWEVPSRRWTLQGNAVSLRIAFQGIA